MRVVDRMSFHALIGAVLLIALVGTAPALAAQAGGSKQILSGQTITWTADWEPLPDVSVEDENVELLALSDGTNIVGYGSTAFPAPASEVRDLLLEGFASEQTLRQVDRGDYDNVSYSIDLATSDGVTLAIFTLVIENPENTTMAMLISSPEQFGTAMTDAQADVAIDGTPIFEGVDATQMQETITATQGTAGSTAPTPTPEATQPAGGLGDLGQAINSTSTPEAPVATAPVAAAPANAATIASSGAEVRYSDDWTVQTQEDASLSLGTVGQPVVLVMVIDLGPVAESMDAAVLATGLQQQVASLSDAEVVAALNPAPDRMVIVFRDPDSSGTLFRIYDIAVDPTATTAVTMIVAESDLEAGVRLVSSTIQVDGESVMTDIPQLVPEIFGGGA